MLDDVEAVGPIALADDRLARREVHLLELTGQPGEVQAPQVGEERGSGKGGRGVGTAGVRHERSSGRPLSSTTIRPAVKRAPACSHVPSPVAARRRPGACLRRRRGPAGRPGGPMRWRDMRRSDNVEDRRGMSVGGAGLKLGGGGLLLILVLSVLTGTNPLDLISGLEEGSPPAVDSGPERKPPADDPQADFIRAVLGDIEDTWGRLFEQGGGTYEAPRLVLFSGAVDSACGQASAAVGPFYCPPDRQRVPRPPVLPGAQRALRRAGRLRARLRRRPRGRAPRPEPPRDLGPRAAAARPDGPGLGERAVRAARAPGGLLRRGVGLLRRAAQRPRAGRRRGGAGGGERRSGTTACRSSRGATSCRSRSPTARPPSASGGSATGLESGDVRRCDTFARAGPEGSRQRSPPAPDARPSPADDLDQGVDVRLRRPVVEHAGAEREPASQHRAGDEGPPLGLDPLHQELVERVEPGGVPGPCRRRVAKAHDR